MYANDDFTRFCSVQYGEYQIPITEEEMEQKIQENIEKNRIDNKYKNKEATLEEVKAYLKQRLRDYFIDKFRKTDDIVIAKIKQSELELWTEDNQNEFALIMKDYTNNLTIYRTLKQKVENATNKNILNIYSEVIEAIEKGGGDGR